VSLVFINGIKGNKGKTFDLIVQRTQIKGQGENGGSYCRNEKIIGYLLRGIKIWASI